MKVLHIIARMNVGGTATYLVNLLQGLRDAGIDNILIFGDVESNEKEDSRTVILNSRKLASLGKSISPYRDFRAYRQFKRIVEEYQPDVIHSHTFKAGVLARLTQQGALLVHSYHGHHLNDSDYKGIKRLLLILIERLLARRNQAIISVGERVRKDLLNYRIGTPERMFSIPPGIKMPEVLNKTHLLTKFGLNTGTLKIVWMGRLTSVKRPDRILNIAALFPEIDFLIAGEGELGESLQTKKSDNVYFLGIQKSDEIWNLADIGLLTSDSEGMPLSLIEAQAAGVPCVATNVGSVSEIITHGKTGFVTDFETESMCEAISKLVNDGNLRGKMSEEARLRARSNFSIKRMVDAHIMVYTRVLP